MSTARQQPEQMRFVFRIEAAEADGVYPLRVSALRGAGGRVLVGVVQTRITPTERLVAQARQLLQPEAALPSAHEEELGMYLARVLLPPAVRTLLLEVVALAREHDSTLEVQLLIEPPELAALPWEWLTVPGKRRWSPALLEDYGIARLAHRAAPAAPATPHNAGVLLVAPSAQDATLLALRTALAAASEPVLPLEVLIAPTNRELRSALRRSLPRVLHLLARAAFDAPDAPLLYLDSPLGAAALAELPDAARPPVVLLDGGRQQAGLWNPAATRMAYALVEQGLGAAIAFHSPLYPQESALFAQALYAALASGSALHPAVALGRAALAEASAAAWGLPMLVVARTSRGLRPDAISAAKRRLPTSPRSARQLALPLLAGTASLLAVATLLLWQPQNARTEASASQPNPTANAFAISLPTPTFRPPLEQPPATSPTIGIGSGPTSTPIEQQPTPATLTGQVLRWSPYLVQPGDTAQSIALKLGSDAQAIAALNRVDVAAPLVAERGLMVPIYREDAPGGNIGGIDVRVGRQDQPLVALTVDTEIDDVILYQILDTLEARGTRATFFVTGNWTRSYPAAARAIVAGGHELGNHSLTHPAFTKIGLDGARTELLETERLVQETTGVSTRPFFRFPYGDKNPQLLELIGSQGYISYQWTADDNAISPWMAGVTANPRSAYGAILLMHQRPASIAALPGWLDQLGAMGIKVVPLSEILK